MTLGTGLHRFMGLDLTLDGAVLAPRAETELLGRCAIDLLKQAGDKEPLVIDMCCGSGNLGVAIAVAIPGANILAADLTDDAVLTAKANAQRHGVSGRIKVCQGDLFNALAGENADGRTDMVVCNPPYISTAKLEGDSAHLLENEPREAFDGGPYGISVLQRVVREAVTFLKPGGYLLFEFGLGQDRQALSLLSRAGAYESIEFVKNADGAPRVAVAKFTGDTR